MHSDPIADLLTRVRNALRAHQLHVDVPHSKIKVDILKILEQEGFITGHEITTEGKFPMIRVHLKYDSRRKPVITKINRVSTPGLRVYKGSAELRPVRSGLATIVVTTSQGVMTDREARRRRIGGEVLCLVY
jgi:small subunit ribosomal protein S8